ncbi:hypothetical protein Kpol_316p8, partial [Vanderwaltozyma polyspora DSM 70294]
YPEGSNQQQITGYGYQDDNNNWYFDKVREFPSYNFENPSSEIEFVEDGATYRLVHLLSGKNLHSHQIPAPVTKLDYEVAGYGQLDQGDHFDYWVLEIAEQVGSENATRIHPLTTSFRLRHKELGCYLAQSGQHLPEWGFRQLEMTCMKNVSKKDKRILWNVESHSNDQLPPVPEDFKFPRPRFLTNFIHLNLAMMATNNALIPDPEKHDHISSSWWEWPTLYTGLRLGGWSDEFAKYYLLGTPITTWASTLAVLAFMLTFVILAIRWQRQYEDLQDKTSRNNFIIGGIYPMLGWGLHYTPFIIMGRVTYLHHYLPALYFALLVLTYFIETGTSYIKNQKVRWILYIIMMASVIGCFALFSPISFGMVGPSENFKYLDWLPTWKVHGAE